MDNIELVRWTMQVSYMILQRVSPVTHSVGNCVKRVVVIVSSVIFFRTPVSFINSLGKLYLYCSGILLPSLSCFCLGGRSNLSLLTFLLFQYDKKERALHLLEFSYTRGLSESNRQRRQLEDLAMGIFCWWVKWLVIFYVLNVSLLQPLEMRPSTCVAGNLILCLLVRSIFHFMDDSVLLLV